MKAQPQDRLWVRGDLVPTLSFPQCAAGGALVPLVAALHPPVCANEGYLLTSKVRSSGCTLLEQL